MTLDELEINLKDVFYVELYGTFIYQPLVPA